ncbi:hypothetical protein EON67_02435 [archaeon]|nr:MAG: hypothetical protein EON67_02435 [archaeon]
MIAADFVGWGGLGPITVLFEYVFGIRPDVPSATIVWDVRLLDAFGVDNYPFGCDGVVALRCASRSRVEDKPVVTVRSNMPLTVRVLWGHRAHAEGGVISASPDADVPALHEEVLRVEATPIV